MDAESQVRRPNGSAHMPARSVRVADDVWEKAKARARAEGVTVSRVAALLIEGYAAGVLATPKLTVIYPTNE